MANNKRPANPLLGVSHFKLEDSFGVQPTLIVPSTASTSTTSPNPASNASQLFSASAPDPFSEVNLNTSPLKPPSSTTASSLATSGPPAPPPVMSLGPPQPGLFLLPNSSPNMPPPSTTMTATSGSKPRSRYVPPPGIHSSSSSGNLPAMLEPASSNPQDFPSMMQVPPAPTSALDLGNSSLMHGSASVPDFGAHNPNAPELYPGQHSRNEMPKVTIPDEPLYHWYYKVMEKSHNVLNPA